MSLLNDYMESCHMLHKITGNDNAYGGLTTTWIKGGAFNASIVFNTSMEARIAEKQGVTNLYTITTRRDVVLEYHDVLVRDSDGKVFRITSDGLDNKTPKSATLDMRQVTAEEWDVGQQDSSSL